MKNNLVGKTSTREVLTLKISYMYQQQLLTVQALLGKEGSQGIAAALGLWQDQEFRTLWTRLTCDELC